MLLGFLVLGLLGQDVAGATSALKVDGKVHELTTKGFNAAIKSHPLSFVEFYAPWCGHCKKLAPEWEKTAQLAVEAAVPVAKVDAIAEKQVAQQQGVGSFPTLKLFRGDPEVSIAYNGPRTAEKMAEWLSSWKSAKLLEVLQPVGKEIRKWAGKKPTAILGVLSGDASGDAAMREVLEAASFALNPMSPGTELPVAETSAAALKELGLGTLATPCAILFRDFDFEEKSVVYEGDGSSWTYKAFMAWLQAKRVPALIPAKKETEQFFLTDIDPGNGLVMLFGGSDTLRKDMHELAVRFSTEEKRLKWVHAKADDFGEALAKNVDLTKSDFPEVVLWEFGESEDQDTTFRLSQQSSSSTMTKSSIEAFVKSWRSKELSAEKDPVRAITSSTFDDEVIDNDKDVLVEFYAPWCGHCKALAPEYKQLAIHYAGDAGVSVVKMDATVHKHESVKIDGYPTLKFYPKGAKGSPIDPGFKANRDKQSLVDFIEKNRKTGKAGAKKGKESSTSPSTSPKGKAKEKAQTPTPKAEKVQGSEQSGVWIFDDVADPASRGQQLSADMVSSRAGYTLVQVADLGLLIPPNSGVAKAVRHFATATAAAEHVKATQASKIGQEQKALEAPAMASSLGRLPCPTRADLTSCKAWCQGVWPGALSDLRPTLGGRTCAEVAKGKLPDHDLPSCMCYDSDYSSLQAMCLSPCEEEASLDVVDDKGSCQAGDASCSNIQTGSGSSLVKGRFFLYDTKYGEGFNLQREVYPRAGWVVAEANKALEAQCGASNVEGKCARWTLVLPPWCRVVHWWSGPEPLSWSTFFDMDVLKKAGVPIIEFEEYVKLVGGQRVNLAVTYQSDKLDGNAAAQLTGRRDGFLGWASQVEHCNGKYHQIPEFQKLGNGELSMVYSGHCEGGIRTPELRCGALDGPWPRGVVDMLLSVDNGISSVFVKGYDYLLSPDAEELDALGLRESMIFSRAIREHGDSYIKNALGGRKYLAAHCRRTDFLRVRSKTTPSANVIAEKLNHALKESGLDQVFIATDAPTDLREDLQRQVKGAVHFYDGASGAVTFDHPGKQAAVEIWIAARADFFIGTIESRFTMWIQLERGFLGKAKQTSEQEFCKEFNDPSKKCIAPHYRQPNRKGLHREAYQG